MPIPVETHRLTKSYGAIRGIEDLDLRVDAGQVFGFLGPNGAGKSTTMRTLLDFQRATGGSAEILGLDIRRDSVEIRRRTGYLTSDVSLFDRMTGADHVRWFSRARGDHDEAYAADLVERLGVTLDRPVKELSKGNRQKVALLLSFMHRPELLILDEPTSGLDPLVQKEFELLLRETAAEGRTVFLSSHSLDEVQRVADRVAIIRDSRLVVADSVEHLRANAARIMTLRFEDEVDPAAFAALVGVERAARRDDGDLELRLTGELRPVLDLALQHQLVDLTARHADLDELFLSYYEDGGESEDQGPVRAGILTLDLSFRRRSLIGYSGGMVLYTLVVVALYPAFKDSTELDQFTEQSEGLAALFGITGSLTSPVGWLNANLYANFLPLLILLLTIGYGAFALAGQEGDGHLELVLSLPFARGRVVLEKIGALLVQATVFSIVVFLSVLVGRAFELTVDIGNIAGTSFGALLLAVDFGLLALAIGAVTGARGTAISIAAAAASASYLISAMAPLVDWLTWARYLSLFYWSVANDQLDSGLGAGGALLLVGVGTVLGAWAVVAFEHHDLS